MLKILYEDKDIVAVDKPEGLASVPESDSGKDSVLSLLAAKYGQKVYPVHRLDKEASGVIIFARNPEAHRFLNEQFAKKTVEKIYFILVHGSIKKKDGIIEEPIREFGSGRMAVDKKYGKRSTTKFHVLKRLKDFTLVKAIPATGRKHQLRVHFYAIGHPIVGDRRYGDKKMQGAFKRLMLHAESLSFMLPSGERKTIKSQKYQEAFANQLL